MNENRVCTRQLAANVNSGMHAGKAAYQQYRHIPLDTVERKRKRYGDGDLYEGQSLTILDHIAESMVQLPLEHLFERSHNNNKPVSVGETGPTGPMGQSGPMGPSGPSGGGGGGGAGNKAYGSFEFLQTSAKDPVYNAAMGVSGLPPVGMTFDAVNSIITIQQAGVYQVNVVMNAYQQIGSPRDVYEISLASIGINPSSHFFNFNGFSADEIWWSRGDVSVSGPTGSPPGQCPGGASYTVLVQYNVGDTIKFPIVSGGSKYTLFMGGSISIVCVA